MPSADSYFQEVTSVKESLALLKKAPSILYGLLENLICSELKWRPPWKIRQKNWLVPLYRWVSLYARGDCERSWFDQLNAHILERLLLCWRPKICTCSWSKTWALTIIPWLYAGTIKSNFDFALCIWIQMRVKQTRATDRVFTYCIILN